jgi:adenylate cyclase
VKKPNKEIERKFLVKNKDFLKPEQGLFIQQGFLSTDKERVVRVRIAGTKAYLTVKGIMHHVSRSEFEYEIPVDDARILLDQICEKPLITKLRHEIWVGGFLWEVDEFLGENEGLIIAEIELQSEHQSFEIPEWLSEEVTNDPKYYNSNLIKYPFKRWSLNPGVKKKLK